METPTDTLSLSGIGLDDPEDVILIPGWYDDYCKRFLSPEEMEELDIKDMLSHFDPVKALVAERGIVKKIGEEEWLKTIEQNKDFVIYSEIISKYMSTPDKNKNLVFVGHTWMVDSTPSKLYNYILGTKGAISVFSKRHGGVKNLTMSNSVDGLLNFKNIIAFKDGVLDMHNFNDGIRQGEPVDLVTTSIGYKIKFNIEPKMQEELDSLLYSIFPDDNLREYFLYHMASCLDSGNLDKVFVIWFGVGNNGKSVLETLVEHTFGSYCYKAPTSLFCSRRSNSSSATPEIVNLNKMLVAFLQESDTREAMNIGVLKELTGNDTIYTRGLYETPKTIEVRCKFILVTNKVYNLSQADDATWARIRVIPFLSTFTDDDEKVDPENNIFRTNPQYIRRVKILAPYFMKLLMEYYPKYKKYGLPKCNLVAENTSSLRKMNSPVALFVEDEMIKSLQCSLRFQEVYEAYRLYARKNCGIRNITAANFEMGLKKIGINLVEGSILGYYLRDERGE